VIIAFDNRRGNVPAKDECIVNNRCITNSLPLAFTNGAADAAFAAFDLERAGRAFSHDIEQSHRTHL